MHTVRKCLPTYCENSSPSPLFSLSSPLLSSPSHLLSSSSPLLSSYPSFVVASDYIQARCALYDTDPMELRERKRLRNECMNSCRESIEWNYGDCQKLFSYLDYNKKLPMRKIPLGKIFLCAMLMRNALVAIRGNNTSLFFRYVFPSNFLETWTQRGPTQVD